MAKPGKKNLEFIAASLLSAKLRRAKEGEELENLQEKYLDLRRGLFNILSPRDRILLEEQVEAARVAYCAKWNEIQDDKIFISYDFSRVVFVCRRDLKGYYNLGLLDDWDMWRDWARYKESQNFVTMASYESELKAILEDAVREREVKELRRKERRRERTLGKGIAR